MSFLHGKELIACAKNYLRDLQKWELEAIVGYDFQGYHLAIATCTLSHEYDYPVNALLVRSREKDHGMGGSVDGVLPASKEVAFLRYRPEDPRTNSQEIIHAQKCLMEVGAKIERFLYIPETCKP